MSTHRPQTFAVVPGAGLSTRMGKSKLGLSMGKTTVLGHVIAALRGGGVDVVLVVIGPNVPELLPLAESAGAETLTLTTPTADMRETVQAGLRDLENRYHPQPEDFWFLAPGDCPGFSPATVARIRETASTDKSSTVWVPTSGKRSGHPTLFSWRHTQDILVLPPGTGINGFSRGRRIHTIPVDDPGVLCDIDTPADHAKLLRDAQKTPWHPG